MTETITTTTTDMSEFWRLISAEGQDDDHRIYGTWWVSTDHIKPVDVTIWDRRSDYGRVLYSDALTAFRQPDGEIRLPMHMIRSTILADCEAAWGLLLAVIKAAAAADTTWKPLQEETTNV